MQLLYVRFNCIGFELCIHTLCTILKHEYTDGPSQRLESFSNQTTYAAQVEPKNAAPKSAKKAEPLYESASDSEEEESADMEDDSSSESPESGTKTAAKSAKASCKSASRTPRTIRASSKKAAKAITAACADLEEEASEKEESFDSEAATEPNESSPPAAATVEQKKGSKLSSQKKKRMGSKSPSHDTNAETDGVRTQGCNSSSPEGSSKRNTEEELKTKSAKKIGKLQASSDDVSDQSESEAESEAEREADPEAESPIPVMLKSRKLQKGDGTTVQSRADDTKRGMTLVPS